MVYLFLHAVYKSPREQAGLKEGILVSRGILSDGSRALIHLSVGNKESYEDWLVLYVSRSNPTPRNLYLDVGLQLRLR